LREEAGMASCPECENSLDVEVDELEEGDVVACGECGSEYEVVGVDPLELTKVDEDYEDEEDEIFGEEEEEE
jgi:alpha-aminoadipate/glutamate carrier protein LysW